MSQVKLEALTRELSVLNERYIKLTSDFKQLQKRNSSLQTHNQAYDKVVRELNSKETDLLVNQLILI